jgi:hypothetical protein
VRTLILEPVTSEIPRRRAVVSPPPKRKSSHWRTPGRPPGASKSARGWSPTEEIGWSRTQEIRWSSTDETGWSPTEEILQLRDFCVRRLCFAVLSRALEAIGNGRPAGVIDKNQHLTIAKILISTARRASNRGSAVRIPSGELFIKVLRHPGAAAPGWTSPLQRRRSGAKRRTSGAAASTNATVRAR